MTEKRRERGEGARIVKIQKKKQRRVKGTKKNLNSNSTEIDGKTSNKNRENKKNTNHAHSYTEEQETKTQHTKERRSKETSRRDGRVRGQHSSIQKMSRKVKV